MAKVTVLTDRRFDDCLKSLSDAEIARIEETLALMPNCFGRPHLHSGISIRRLRANIYECRAGLRLRLLFRAKGSRLEFFFVGNHDEVRQLLKALR